MNTSNASDILITYYKCNMQGIHMVPTSRMLIIWYEDIVSTAECLPTSECQDQVNVCPSSSHGFAVK